MQVADYYEATAQYCATAGYTDPMLVRALLDVPAETMEEIEADPQAFKERVADYAYGMAMEKIPEYF